MQVPRAVVLSLKTAFLQQQCCVCCRPNNECCYCGDHSVLWRGELFTSLMVHVLLAAHSCPGEDRARAAAFAHPAGCVLGIINCRRA